MGQDEVLSFMILKVATDFTKSGNVTHARKLGGSPRLHWAKVKSMQFS